MRVPLLLLFALVLPAWGAEAPVLRADFEGPETGFALTADGAPTRVADEVIAGAASLRLDSSASSAEWHEILTSDAGLIPAESTVLVSFDYRWLAKPADGGESGTGSYLYALLRSPTAPGKDIGFTVKAFDEFRGKDGAMRRVLTTGKDPNYRLIIGLHRQARVAIDRVSIAVHQPRTEAPPPEAVGPPAGRAWTPVPELSDEFNAPSLDLAKWVPNAGGWKGRAPAFFDPRNVALEDGFLTLQLKRGDYAHDPALAGLPPEYHTWTSASVHSAAKQRYGFFEIRAQPVAATASSAFWFSDDGSEIDVFEIGGTAPAFAHTVHSTLHVFPAAWNGNAPHWARNSTWDLDRRPVDAFNIYSLQWDKELIAVCINGQEVARFANTHWQRPMPVIFDIETMPDWFGLPQDGDALPGRFRIDWIRTWRAADD